MALVWVPGQFFGALVGLDRRGRSQMEHQPVTRAARGSEVALKVRTRVRRHGQGLRVPELEPPRVEVDEP